MFKELKSIINKNFTDFANSIDKVKPIALAIS